MGISKFENYKEKNIDLDLRFYAFDWDDNILFMPTEIILWNDKHEPIGMETGDWAKYRTLVDKEPFIYKGEKIIGLPKNNDGTININMAFSNFCDLSTENIFLKDIIKAINLKKFGPSWNDFIECLTNGSLFSIITARGHESNTIRKGVEYILDNYLNNDQKYEMYNNLLKYAYLFKNDHKYPRIYKGIFTENKIVIDYLDKCEFIGVSSPSRKGGTPDNPEEAKVEALLNFKRRVNKFAKRVGMKAKIGFSDDDIKNIKHIENLFNEVDNEEFSDIIQWVVKNTNDPNNISKSVRINENILHDMDLILKKEEELNKLCIDFDRYKLSKMINKILDNYLSSGKVGVFQSKYIETESLGIYLNIDNNTSIATYFSNTNNGWRLCGTDGYECNISEVDVIDMINIFKKLTSNKHINSVLNRKVLKKMNESSINESLLSDIKLVIQKEKELNDLLNKVDRVKLSNMINKTLTMYHNKGKVGVYEDYISANKLGIYLWIDNTSRLKNFNKMGSETDQPYWSIWGKDDYDCEISELGTIDMINVFKELTGNKHINLVINRDIMKKMNEDLGNKDLIVKTIKNTLDKVGKENRNDKSRHSVLPDIFIRFDKEELISDDGQRIIRLYSYISNDWSGYLVDKEDMDYSLDQLSYNELYKILKYLMKYDLKSIMKEKTVKVMKRINESETEDLFEFIKNSLNNVKVKFEDYGKTLVIKNKDKVYSIYVKNNDEIIIGGKNERQLYKIPKSKFMSKIASIFGIDTHKIVKKMNEDNPAEFRINTMMNFNHFNQDRMGAMQEFAPRVNTEINRISNDIFKEDEVEDENGEVVNVDIDSGSTGLSINGKEVFDTPDKDEFSYPYGQGNYNVPRPNKFDSKPKREIIFRFADYRGIDGVSPGSMYR